MENEYATVGYVNLLFGIWCAKWAQSSDQSPWGWFFFGLFLAPIAGIVILTKNKNK